MDPQFLRIVPKLARMGRRQQVTARRLLALGCWLLAKTVTLSLWASEASMRWISHTFACNFCARRRSINPDPERATGGIPPHRQSRDKISFSNFSTSSSMGVASSAFSRLRMRCSCGGRLSSGNRDAEDGPPDSGQGGGVNASFTSGGRSSQTCSQVATSFVPCLISVFGPQEFSR